MNNLGFLAALGAALFWGSYMVPFKRAGVSNLKLFQALLAFGIGLSGLAISLILGYPLTLNPYGLLSGVLWALANMVGLAAVANLGLSRSVPLMSSLVVISSFLWGAFVFRELPAGVAAGAAGILLIIAGVVLVSLTEKIQSHNVKAGLILATLAGLIWGSQLVPLKWGNVSTRDFFFSVCLGIALTGLLVFVLFRGKFKKGMLLPGFLSGFVWNIGNLLSLLAVSLIGLAKAGPISQATVLVAIFWGIFYFKEATTLKIKLQILAGATVLMAGIFILGSA